MSRAVVIVGVTGGFGSGKSTVMAGLSARGAAIISADQIVHDLLNNDAAVTEAVRVRFGDAVFVGGIIDRRVLATQVFADEMARKDLESILHPRVREEIAAQLKMQTEESIVAVEIPLLAESGWHGFDLVVTVEAVDDVVLDRARAAGWNETDVKERKAAQVDDFERREIADVVLHNNDDDAHLQNELDELWNRIAALSPRDPGSPWPGPDKGAAQ